MADDVILNLGSGGDTIAADDDGSRKHQYVKVEFGANDTQTPVDATNPLPVTRPNVTASGALGAAEAAVTLSGQGTGTVNWEIDTGTLSGTVVFEATLDDSTWFAIDAMRLDGTIIVSTTTFADRGVLTSSGYSQVRLRVSVYTSGTSNARMEASEGASVVRLGDSLPAGSATLGTVNIGTFPDNEPIDVAQVAGTTASVNAGAVDAGTQRVVLPNDQASLTVDAPVATPVAARLSDGAAFLTTTGGRLDVNPSGVTSPVSAASLPLPTGAATSAAQLADNHQVTVSNASLTADQGAAGIAWEVEGDVAHDAPGTSENPLLVGGYSSAAAPTDVSLDGDAVRAWFDPNGAQYVGLQNNGTIYDGRDRSWTITETVNADLDSLAGTAIDVGAGNQGSGTQRVVLASDQASVTVDQATATNLLAAIDGTVAHDALDSGGGGPLKVGGIAIAHGTNPTEVAAADRTNAYHNVAGVPFVIGGHPNVGTEVVKVLDSDNGQTDIAIFSTTEKIVCTRVSVACDNANTADVRVLVGFGATTLPAPSTTGATGLLLEHPGIPAGGGITVGDGSGILGVGAAGEDLRYTCEDPVGGSVTISVSYYEISA